MTLLSVENVSLSFAGLKALQDVNFKVEKGSIHGLIGPNGAGKSTLLNCLSRIYTPDNGRILYSDRDLLRVPIHGIAPLGISRTFQNLELFSLASVRENIVIGALLHHENSLFSDLLTLPAARRNARAVAGDVDALLAEFGLVSYANLPVSSLSFGIQKTVELARALAGRPRLLLLDEPAAGMNPEESRQLGEAIRRLRDGRGMTVLLVEHDMPLVMGICDNITVLNQGQVICEGAPADVRSDPRVVTAYLGEETTVA